MAFPPEIAALIDFAATSTKCDSLWVRRLAENLLAGCATGERSVLGSSHLNNDGMPIELCVSVSTNTRNLRIVADPASHIGDPIRRLTASRRTLNDTLRSLGLEGFASLCNTLLDKSLPDSETDLKQYRMGVFWIAAGLTERGAAVYLDANPTRIPDNWEAVAKSISCILSEPGPALQAIHGLRSSSTPASLALEGRDQKSGRFKLYWRLRKALPLRELGVSGWEDPCFAEFLTEAVGNRPMNLT